MLYPSHSPNALQFVNPPSIDIQNQYEASQFENFPTGAADETSDGTDGSFEEGGGDENVGEETGSDFWQSFIDYFGICEGSKIFFRKAIPSQIKVNRFINQNK